jgi:cytochrome P450
MSALVNVLSPEYHNNIYDRYAQLRDNHPAYYDKSRNIWMITRYEDVRAILRDTASAMSGDNSHSYVPTIAGSDGELHKHVRGRVISRLGQSVVKMLAPKMEQIMGELFAALPPGGEIDIYNEVVKRVPQRFITHFLGFPEQLCERWFELGDPLMGVDPLNMPDEVDHGAGMALLDEVMSLMQEVLEHKRQHPGDDFLSWLVAQQEEGELTEQEVAMVANNLGVGALDTTINLLGNGTGLLARFPEERAKLIANSELLDGAIEEMLRMESPAQALPRRLLADLKVGSTVIPKGEEISLVFAAANHDPEKYPDPDQFDIERKNFDHLAMGFGLHKCMGQHIARMEARSFFTHLLKHYPDYTVSESRWLVSWWARGYAALVIKA